MKSGYDVIIPCRNMAEFLVETIQSLLNSTIKPNRIIVVDDGSTDETSKIASQFKMVELIRHETSQGKSNSRNEALRLCTAEFIQMIDADDLLAPDKVEKQILFMNQNTKCDFCFGDVTIFQDGMSPNTGEKRTLQHWQGKELEELIKRNHIALHSILWRGDFFKRFGFFDPFFMISQDRELYMRAILAGAKLCYVSETMCYYRRHQKSSIKSQQFEGSFFNAMSVRKHREALSTWENGRLKPVLVSSLRMLARNANMYGRPLKEVYEMIDEVKALRCKPAIEQNGLYKVVEKMLGAKFLETLLAPKFRVDRTFRTME